MLRAEIASTFRSTVLFACGVRRLGAPSNVHMSVRLDKSNVRAALEDPRLLGVPSRMTSISATSAAINASANNALLNETSCMKPIGSYFFDRAPDRAASKTIARGSPRNTKKRKGRKRTVLNA